MTRKTLIPLFALPIVPVIALTFTLSAGSTPVSASNERGRALHVAKECLPESAVGAWPFCTITVSNVGPIVPGARVYYVDPPNLDLLLQDSAVVLDAGNGNRAVGRCTVDYQTGLGLCTFSDGTGSLAGFNARVKVTPPAEPGAYWHWDGTYSFSPLD